MAGFHRPRKPVDSRFLPADAKRWRRLIHHVRHIARAPLADAVPMVKAGEACAKAVVPPGYAVRGSIFLQLLLKVRAFWALATDHRPPAAKELGGLADACATVLDRHAEGAAGPPPRADIFG